LPRSFFRVKNYIYNWGEERKGQQTTKRFHVDISGATEGHLEGALRIAFLLPAQRNNIAASAGPVLDDELLAEPFRQPLAQMACGDVAPSDQSALRPANLTTLPHFSVSSAMNFPNSRGQVANPLLPRSANRALITACRRLSSNTRSSLTSKRPAWHVRGAIGKLPRPVRKSKRSACRAPHEPRRVTAGDPAAEFAYRADTLILS